MRTVTFKSVLTSLAQRCTLAPDPTDFTLIDAEKLVSFINDRLPEAWEWAFWPEWTVVERRQYRPSWLIGTAYVVDDQVLNDTDELYYTCIQNGTGQQPDLAPLYWELTEEMDRYVAYEQTDAAGTALTEIGEVETCSSKNPKTNPKYPGFLGFEPSDNGIQVSNLAPFKVWLKFRLRPPGDFTSIAYDALTAYVVGDRVFDVLVSGNCYVCIQNGTGQAPASSPLYWEIVEFPYILKKFVVQVGFADYLGSTGEEKKGEKAEAKAYSLLVVTEEVAFGQQSQADQAQVQMYP